MIGPKCVNCRKNLSHHEPKSRACPMGKRSRTLGYAEFHPSQAFLAKPPSKGGASEGRKDRSQRRLTKANPCIVCGAGGCDPCHVRGFYISQCDEPWNLVPMCRPHHVEQSNRGWLHMAGKYEQVNAALAKNGWEFIVYESTGDWSMFNPLEVEFQRKRRAV